MHGMLAKMLFFFFFLDIFSAYVLLGMYCLLFLFFKVGQQKKGEPVVHLTTVANAL